jgi:hypothetical protein
MAGRVCLLLCLLIGTVAHGQAQSDAGQQESTQPNSVVAIAAELAHIASKLALSGATGAAQGRRFHRRQQPAAARSHAEPAAVQGVNKGLVQSVPVDFKSHNLTIVALTNE